VAFRLLCPVSFRSAFSLLRIVKRPESVVSTMPPIPTTPSEPVIPIEPPMSDIMPPANVPADTITAAGTDWLTVFAVIWCVGIATMLVYAVISWFKVCRRLNNAVLLSENVWQSDKVRSPIIVGVLRPKIYIPFNLDEGALHYALAHERCHLSRFDHVVRPLAYLILALHWFNPLCWMAYFLMVKDMEMSCDEAVLKSEPSGQKAYSHTLVSFAANKRFPAPNPLAFGETGVKKRIKNILNWKKPRTWVTVAAVVLCAAVLVACAANPTVKVPESEPGLKLGSGDNWVLANWYAEGFDFDYDKLNTLTVERNTELRFEPDFPVENLTIGEDLYIRIGDAANIQQKTITLTPDENGEYRHSLKVGESANKAVYFIPYEEGKFVIKVLFADNEESPDPTITYSYSLPEYRGTTELDAEIWAALQPPEGGITNHWDIPSLHCGNRKLFKNEWNVRILDASSFRPDEGPFITDPAGLFEAMNISGWELIYDGSLHRYIDQEGDKLITEETVYELSMYSSGLQLTFIEGTDICGYSIMDPEAGRAAKMGVARIPEETAEAILNFVSPGFARAEYVEPPYKHGFLEGSAAIYSGPGGGVLVNLTDNQILLKITEAAMLDDELWLKVRLPNFKSPGNDEGWLPAALVTEYTEDMFSQITAPLLIPEGTEYYECDNVADISDTEAKIAEYDIRVYRSQSKKGYSLVGRGGGDERVWVKDSDLQPDLS
ncbi:MAG: M56 family metallopeptidase, partial [Oscillospiraceae bacterium]|nr:M56 family metallopeptidase [Oscillospiraceae bacterium]